MSKLAHMLHNREKSILGSPSFVLVVFIENTQAKRGGNDLVWNGKNLIEADKFFHFNGSVSEEEPFKLNAEHVWKLAKQLFVSCPDVPPVMLVVLHGPLLKVRCKTLFKRIITVSWDFEV